MKKLNLVLCGMAFLTLPYAVRAEDGGTVEDAAVVADAAVAHDAAVATPDAAVTADAGPVGCGSLTWQGECAGAGNNTMRYCDGTEVVEHDCSTDGADVMCGLMDCTDTAVDDRGDPICNGYGCVAKPNTACGLGDAPGSCDHAQNSACVGGTCVAGTSCVDDTYTAACNGAWLSFCNSGLVNENNCNEIFAYYQLEGEATCGVMSDGTNFCQGLEGATCDEANGLECSAGLTCGDDGYCGTGSAGTDAGTVKKDAGTTAAKDAGKASDDGDSSGGLFGCSATGMTAPALAFAVALAGLALIRRRRA